MLASAQTLSLLDQAVVSAASLATTVMVSRWATAGDLGVFAVGTSILVSIVAAQEALVALPYTILRRQSSSGPQEQAGTALAQSALLALVCALALLVCGRLSDDMPLMAALAVAAPFALLRDFTRRFNFAHLNLKGALFVDCGVALFQLAALASLGMSGRLTAAAAFLSGGAACAVLSLLFLWRSRPAFPVRLAALPIHMKQSWELGKWLLFGQLTVQAQSYAMTWLSAVLLGATSTGVYSACASVVALSNPLLLGLGNVLTPRAMRALNEGGATRLRAQAMRDALALGAAMSGFCLVIAFLGDVLMGLLFHGPEYGGQGSVLIVLALAQSAQVIGTPASNALKSLQRPRPSALAAFAGAIAALLLVWLMMLRCDIYGAAYGLLIGNLIGSAGRWAIFLRLSAQVEDKRDEAFAALRRFAPQIPESGWELERAGEGAEGIVYFARSRDSERRDAAELVVKLWKPGAEAAKAQAEKLARLSEALEAAREGTWRFFAPRPMATDVSAIVMARVPGRNLNDWMASGENLSREVMDEIAVAAISALEQCWSRGESHGDLAFQNLLCDFEGKRLSLIDAGVNGAGSICPAARDLAALLSDAATDVKQSIGNVAARERRQYFARMLVGRYLATLPTKHERRRLLAQAADHAETIVSGWLPRSCTAQGLWRSIVRMIAEKRLRRLVALIEMEAGLSPAPASEDGSDSPIPPALPRRDTEGRRAGFAPRGFRRALPCWIPCRESAPVLGKICPRSCQHAGISGKTGPLPPI